MVSNHPFMITPAELQAQILKIQKANHTAYEKDQRVLGLFEEALNKHRNNAGFASTRAREILNSLKLWALTIKQKVSLYAHIANGNATIFIDEDRVFQHIQFELRDSLLKEASQNPSNIGYMVEVAGNLNIPKLKKAIQDIADRKPILLSLSKKTQNVTNQNWKNFSLKAGPPKPIAKPKQAKNGKSYYSLFVSLEYQGASVGGIAAVTTSLSKFMNEKGHDVRMITPCYDTYIEAYPEARFVTTLEHYYKGQWVTSSVYKVWTQDNKVAQYLLKPPFGSSMMEIGNAKSVYNGEITARTAFTNSAAPGFASRYTGRNHQKQFDVLHTHHTNLTPCLRLLKEVYSPKRKNCHLKPIAAAGHIHGTGYYAQSTWYPASAIKDVGLSPPPLINLQAEAYRYLDVNIHVGEKTAELAKTKSNGYSLEKLVKESDKQGRVLAVQNGIPVEKFQPTNHKVLGEFSFKTENGVIDFINGRSKIKKALYEEGIIADPNKPLFMYVGRFGLDKGVDALPSIVKQIYKEGGQCLIMGASVKDPRADKHINTLKKMTKKHPTAIRLMTSIEEQKAHFKNTKIPVGTLIRAATFCSIVPSHRETCGLVIKELWAAGALSLTSNAEGIADNGRGLGKKDKNRMKNTIDNFNAFTYKDSGNYLRGAERAAKQAMNFYKNTSDKNRNEIANRLYNEAKDNYSWNSSIKQMEKAYSKAVKPSTTDEVKARQKVYDRYMKRNKGFFARLRLRLHKFFTGVIWKVFKAKVLYVLTFIPFKISQIAQRIFHPKKKKTAQQP